MDRVIVYPGQIPLDTDFLKTQRNKMLGLGFMADTILGQSSLFDGLACQQTTPASMSVQVLPGTVYVAQPTDSIPFGSIGSDPFRNTVKQGILRDAATLTLVAPVTTGHAVNYLIQAAFSEVEAQPVVLPYYNSANPAQPYSGPENSGVAQYTERRGALLVSAKAGASAISGSQTTPAPDPGYVGLYVITVAYGATSITSGNITRIPTAPFLPAKLPEIPSGVRDGRWIYAQDTGTANSIVAEVTPAPTAYRAGMGVRVKIANANTGPTVVNLNGLGEVSLRRADGTNLQEGDLFVGMVADMVHDGDRWQLANSTGLTVMQSVGDGVDIYQGKLSGIESIRSLVAGANITLTLVESPAESGRFAVEIAATPGDLGEVPINVVNIGAGVNLYKGLNGANHEMRSIQGDGLLTAALGGTDNNEVRVRMANTDGARLLMRSPNSNGTPAFTKITGTTFQPEPLPADKLLMERDGTGNLEHTSVQAILARIGSPWEIASQVEISSAVGTIEMLFEADRYSKLILQLDDWRVSKTGSGIAEHLEACLMNDSTVITRAPMYPISNKIVSVEEYAADVNGSLEWSLSNMNNRTVIMESINLIQDVATGVFSSAFPVDPRLFGYTDPSDTENAVSMQRYVCNLIGLGSGTFMGPNANAGATPVNKLRLRWLKFTSLYSDVYTVRNTTAGRATLYGLKRSI